MYRKDSKPKGNGRIEIMFGNKPEQKETEAQTSEKLQYTARDFGDYTPMQLASKLEDANEAILQGNAREASTALETCILRLRGKVGDDKKDGVSESDGLEQELLRTLS